MVTHCTALLPAQVWGYSGVVVGNERSASHGNGRYVGKLEVNHQFDKSVLWERKFRQYFCDTLGSRVDYFSPLQPLWEVQIAAIFALEPELRPYWSLFRSCNEGGGEWCGHCAKCCFVFALFAAWRERSDVAEALFAGADPLDDEQLLPEFGDLLGSGNAMKPLDCVGTAEEALLSLWLARRRSNGRPMPYVLAAVAGLDDHAALLSALPILDAISDNHCLPPWWRRLETVAAGPHSAVAGNDTMRLASLETLRELRPVLEAELLPRTEAS